LKSKPKARLKIEIVVVLALSLGASAIYSIVSIISRLSSEVRLADQTATINRQLSDREWLDFTYQFLALAFGLAPVALVLFLLWEKSLSPLDRIGLNLKNPIQDIIRGLWLAALIGIPGLGLYVAARQLGISAEVIPAALGQYWWTIPMLLLAAVKASLLEEVVIVGYLFQRLQQLGFSKTAQVFSSAALRATYHLYQGFGGFLGNFVMGLVFGFLYQRFGRIMPLVIAHFLLDAAVFVWYALLKDALTFL
jgi:membrane protease YdiL (CAAX protease family)